MRTRAYSSFSTVCAVLACAAAQTAFAAEGPFGGTPAAIPGTVQAENYDTGGSGAPTK
jgi:hypothetical protein